MLEGDAALKAAGRASDEDLLAWRMHVMKTEKATAGVSSQAPN